MNQIFYIILAGLDVVIGLTLVFFLLLSDFSKKLTKTMVVGLFITAIGMVGQAICVITNNDLNAPIYDQLWAFKDIGIAIFTCSLIGQWIEDMYAKKSQD
jgi:chromate transport protein ChrA